MGSMESQGSLKVEEVKQESLRELQLWKDGQKDAMLLALKIEKGARSSGMGWPLKARKGKEI